MVGAHPAGKPGDTTVAVYDPATKLWSAQVVGVVPTSATAATGPASGHRVVTHGPAAVLLAWYKVGNGTDIGLSLVQLDAALKPTIHRQLLKTNVVGYPQLAQDFGADKLFMKPGDLAPLPGGGVVLLTHAWTNPKDMFGPSSRAWIVKTDDKLNAVISAEPGSPVGKPGPANPPHFPGPGAIAAFLDGSLGVATLTFDKPSGTPPNFGPLPSSGTERVMRVGPLAATPAAGSCTTCPTCAPAGTCEVATCRAQVGGSYTCEKESKTPCSW